MFTTTANVASVPGPFMMVSRSMSGTIFDVSKVVNKPKKRKKTPIEIGMISVDGGTISSSKFVLESMELSEQRNVLDKKWIDGSRKWWKKIVAGAKKFDNASGEKAGEEAIAYLEGVRQDLSKLREDLYLIKGMWPSHVTGDKKIDVKSDMFKPSNKIAWDFEEADKLLQNHIVHIERMIETFFDIGSFANRQNPDLRDNLSYGKGGGKDALDAFLEEVPDVMKKVDGIISGKMYRRLSVFAKELSKYSADSRDEFHDTEALKEFSVGRVKVLMNYADQKYDVDSLSRGGNSIRRPGQYKRLVKAITSAHKLITKAGFGKAWYGRIDVQPQGKATEFTSTQTGNKFKAGATWAHSDYVTIYDNMRNMDGMVSLLIHEVGHRWYYKFMSQGDRARFDSWFGEVAATTSYGKEKPGEDFAEVFADYVVGKKNLSRDQLERFKEFALLRGKIKRQEDDERPEGVLSRFIGE